VASLKQSLTDSGLMVVPKRKWSDLCSGAVQIIGPAKRVTGGVRERIVSAPVARPPISGGRRGGGHLEKLSPTAHAGSGARRPAPGFSDRRRVPGRKKMEPACGRRMPKPDPNGQSRAILPQTTTTFPP